MIRIYTAVGPQIRYIPLSVSRPTCSISVQLRLELLVFFSLIVLIWSVFAVLQLRPNYCKAYTTNIPGIGLIYLVIITWCGHTSIRMVTTDMMQPLETWRT